jgi:hypothetical protein
MRCAVLASTVFLLLAPAPALPAVAQAARTGTIEGHVHVMGAVPANPRIRMGADPMCGAMYPGARPLQEVVLTGAGGTLANVFVNLEGKFPATPVPSTPVVIDQRGCIFVPRVIGARVGQPLQIKNSDKTTHTAHGITAKGNDFNVSQPKAGMVSTVALKAEEMLRVRCDIHSWMTTWVGVVPHPYFAVSDMGGTFHIANVPPGKYSIRAWHELYGPQMRTVEIKAGQTANVDFAYSGQGKS